MGKRKTPEEKADEERRYRLAREASTDAEFEPFFDDPNQAIRAAAAWNPAASEAVLARFAVDRFWGTRLSVVDNPNVTEAVLRLMVETDRRQRGAVDHAARTKLVELGFTELPVEAATD